MKRVEKAKIGLIQFCVSPPKTDMEHNVIISDYTQMDRVLKEERQYILNIVKKIKAANCNVLLIQKSILRWLLLILPFDLNDIQHLFNFFFERTSETNLMQTFRDAVSDLALHFFEKMKIMVVKDIEREDIEFICKVILFIQYMYTSINVYQLYIIILVFVNFTCPIYIIFMTVFTVLITFKSVQFLIFNNCIVVFSEVLHQWALDIIFVL